MLKIRIRNSEGFGSPWTRCSVTGRDHGWRLAVVICVRGNRLASIVLGMMRASWCNLLHTARRYRVGHLKFLFETILGNHCQIISTRFGCLSRFS